MDHEQRIAVIGSGISGLTAAWLLQRKYEVDLYEENDYLGGHTCTVEIPHGPDKGTPVDMGFIVMNHRNYPVLTRIFKELDVELQDTSMSFSFFDRSRNYYWGGAGLNALFAKRSNLFNPHHVRMLADVIRFNSFAREALENDDLDHVSLWEFLEKMGCGNGLIHDYILPMGAAIWSAPPSIMGYFPASCFLKFFNNHGLLTIKDKPQWCFVKGGSRTYVEKMLAQYKGRHLLNTRVDRVSRSDSQVKVSVGAKSEIYDKVVFACHADEVLRILKSPTRPEKEAFRAWNYLENTCILHKWDGLMPPSRAAWSSWNVHRDDAMDHEDPVSVTYWMNRLQALKTKDHVFVSLNTEGAIPDDCIYEKRSFTHPEFTFDSLASQPKIKALSGQMNTYYCGAYLGYGFHEDGARSALEAAALLGIEL